MSRLDHALREALRREEPPEGFAARVLQKVERAEQPASRRAAPRGWWNFPLPGLRWAAAMAVLLVFVGAFEYRRVRQERARDQLMLALRITGSQLHKVQNRIHWVEAPIEQ